MLKNCRKELSRPLFILWRASLDQGLIPADLLLVLISPVHKGGSRGIPKNYRPVALTSHIVKVFERVIRRSLVKHLEENNLLPDGQHGFRAYRSTLTQLLSYWDTILEELEQGHGVDVIYTDSSKAFDKVESGVLFHKLKECGITSFRRRSLFTMKTIWKTLVQPKLDYCSQYWSPGDQESINKIESVQRHFLSNVCGPGGDDLNYWAKLSKYQLTSQERRRDRYMIIFLWKIAQGLVHGYHVEFTSAHGRRGRIALPKIIVQSSSSLVKKARESSLGVKGAQIFNLLPPTIRNINSDNGAHFKQKLDTFLSEVPDQPTIAGYGRAAETNSLLHQLPLFLLNTN